MMDTFLTWLMNNPEKSIPIAGASLALVFGGCWTAITFLQQVRVAREQRQFERYHELVGQLNRGIEGTIYIDFQLNAVYELRFFRKYYPRSERIIKSLIVRWEKSSVYCNDHVNELKATLSYIKWRKSIAGTVLANLINLFWPFLK